MPTDDDENIALAETTESVDQLNKAFYEKYPYPWPPLKFDYLLDRDLGVVLLNQNIGDWKHNTVPKDPIIWVAGCGANQAIFTALRFPRATVLGTDLSTTSLDRSATIVNDLHIPNLVLREESIHHAGYRDQFDYIICTGVIHHNANPRAALAKLAAALKPTGVLELMVHNRFHRTAYAAFQKAVRTLCGSGATPDYDTELSIARKLIQLGSKYSILSSLFPHYNDYPQSLLADALIQPVEYSFTIESLQTAAANCGLELLTPYVSDFDAIEQRESWNIDFKDDQLQQSYESLDDALRWQITNLLLLEKSPLLWFYLQRQDSSRPRKSEKHISEEFLDTVFSRIDTVQRSYALTDAGIYVQAAKSVPFPVARPREAVAEIIALSDGNRSIREIFRQLAVQTPFSTVNRLRVQLTTSAFPYLKAVNSGENRNTDIHKRLDHLALRSIKPTTVRVPYFVSTTTGEE